MKITKFVFLLGLLAFGIEAFETSHLPISNELKQTFPKIKTPCFIICNLDCDIVLHEQKSNYQIPSMIFDKLIQTDRDSLNLFELCVALKNENTMPEFIFESETKFGGVFMCEIKESGKYLVALYGSKTKSDLTEAISQVKKWLNQFYTREITPKANRVIKVPVLYGAEKAVEINLPSKKLLFSKHLLPQVQRVIHYRTGTCAPICLDDNLGNIFYITKMFKNPITDNLKTSKSINKTGLFQRIIDSVHYVIFGNSRHFKHTDQY